LSLPTTTSLLQETGARHEPPSPAREAPRWRTDRPAQLVLLLILATTLCRVAAGWLMGLGVDESYVVAAGRTLQWGYFDHPPAVWWLSWAAAHLAGTDAAAIVRLPFIALFALSTWLMFRLTGALYGARAGLWAAIGLNLAPVLGVTTGGWVLPDGPLDAALLGATLCLVRALGSERGALGWWLGAGFCAGLALLSKYSAVLSIIGAALFVLLSPPHRRWLARPGPWLAFLLALGLFAPVLVWNAEHGWASFAFQGARAEAARLNPLGPVVELAGQSLYLLPWIWLGLVLAAIQTLRAHTTDWPGRLLCCLAAPPILLFTLTALWARNPVLFHWAAPGYLMLFPLLGRWAATSLAAGARWPLRWALASALLVLGGIGFVATEVGFDWLPRHGLLPIPADASVEAVDWTSIRAPLARHGLPVAALNWRDTGKIAYALDGAAPVICLNPDQRQWGLDLMPDRFVGQEILIVARAHDARHLTGDLGGALEAIEPLPPVAILHAGLPALELSVFHARLRAWPPQTASSGAT